MRGLHVLRPHRLTHAAQLLHNRVHLQTDLLPSHLHVAVQLLRNFLHPRCPRALQHRRVHCVLHHQQVVPLLPHAGQQQGDIQVSGDENGMLRCRKIYIFLSNLLYVHHIDCLSEFRCKADMVLLPPVLLLRTKY